jgi:hypothetical protein
MELFYVIVSVVTVIILILLLTFVGLMMRNGKKTQQFPPNIEQCPDMWIPDGSYCHFNGVNNGTYAISTDKKYLKDGTMTYDNVTVSSNEAPIKTKIDNTSPYFVLGGSTPLLKDTTTIEPANSKWSTSGVSAICQQNKWATKYGIQWSGISQLNNCT